MNKEKYIPSSEEVKKDEEMMTGQEKLLSEWREEMSNLIAQSGRDGKMDSKIKLALLELKKNPLDMSTGSMNSISFSKDGLVWKEYCNCQEEYLNEGLCQHEDRLMYTWEEFEKLSIDFPEEYKIDKKYPTKKIFNSGGGWAAKYRSGISRNPEEWTMEGIKEHLLRDFTNDLQEIEVGRTTNGNPVITMLKRWYKEKDGSIHAKESKFFEVYSDTNGVGMAETGVPMTPLKCVKGDTPGRMFSLRNNLLELWDEDEEKQKAEETSKK